MRALLLHNPTSGDGSPPADRLIAALAHSGIAASYRSKEDDTYVAALAEPWDLIVVAGGDGTVGKLVRQLSDRSTPIAILPTGTANNVARSLGLAGNPEAIAARLRGASLRELDIGLAKGPWGERNFIKAVGVGAVAEAIVREGQKPPLPDRIREGREALCDKIRAAKPRHHVLTVDGVKIEGEFLFVEVLNLRFSGARLPIAFSAEAGDRLLDIVLLSEDQRERMLAWIANDPEQVPPPVAAYQGRRVALSWEGAPLRVDDDAYAAPEGPQPIEISLDKESLRVLCPA